MTEEEFEKYREEVLETLKNYRKDIEQYTDEIQIKLETFWNDFRIEYRKWIDGEGYPSQPKDAHMFFYRIDKELLCIVAHLKETGEWRVPCAVEHFDCLLYCCKKD